MISMRYSALCSFHVRQLPAWTTCRMYVQGGPQGTVVLDHDGQSWNPGYFLTGYSLLLDRGPA
jgi:hypothetical protein